MNALQKLASRLTTARIPKEFARQPQRLSNFLPYESMINRNRPLVLLSDGSLGAFWKLTPVAHEAMSENELAPKLSTISQILQIKSSCDVYFQFVFDSAPCRSIGKPLWFDAPQSFEQHILRHRILEIEKESETNEKLDLRLMERSVYLFLRVVPKKQNVRPLSPKLQVAGAKLALATLEAEIETLAVEVDALLMRAGISFEIGDEKMLSKLVKTLFHNDRDAGGKVFLRPCNEGRLSNILTDDFVQLSPSTVSLRSEAWQVLSLKEAPQATYPGYFAELLKIKVPMRVVVNVRSVDCTETLMRKEYFLRNARDAVSERQQVDVKGALEGLAYGEQMLGVSVHFLVRHDSLESSEKNSEQVKRSLENVLGLPVVSEKFAAPLIFWSVLPFGFEKDITTLVQRESMMLSSTAVHLAPIYSGFQGTGKKLKTQVLQNRAGEPFYLSMRASETSAHLAVLASSGAGKSFFCTNILVAERAQGESLTFIIDKRTSYEILAATLGERRGFRISKPPERFPNIFRGELDAEGERLLCIVSLIKSAISLTSVGESVCAIKTSLLSAAVQKAFSDLQTDSLLLFDESSSEMMRSQGGKYQTPTLSLVVDGLTTVCESQGFDLSHAKWLRDRLSPFYGNGPYARLLDAPEFVSADDVTPSVTLYDLEGVSSDKVLSTLTALMIVSDVMRQIKKKENRGKNIQLVIDEAGVIGSDSPEIANFIDDAWRTFRKLGVMGVGLTNTVADYKFKPGPKTIWAVSPNKIVLRMTGSELDDAFKESPEAPALLKRQIEKELIESLVKKDGVYSQGVFISETLTGSFHYKPTGFEYWLAASKPEEVGTVHEIAKKLADMSAPYEKTVSYLAHHFPRGIRNSDKGAVRVPTPSEIDAACKSIRAEVSHA